MFTIGFRTKFCSAAVLGKDHKCRRGGRRQQISRSGAQARRPQSPLFAFIVVRTSVVTAIIDRMSVLRKIGGLLRVDLCLTRTNRWRPAPPVQRRTRFSQFPTLDIGGNFIDIAPTTTARFTSPKRG